MSTVKLTFQQIVDKLNEKEISINEFGDGDFGSSIDDEAWTTCFVEGLGIIKEVEQYGGEDQGSTWYTVRHFVDHDVYIRVDAYYSSYEGADFGDSIYVEVFPTEVTKIEYLPKK